MSANIDHPEHYQQGSMEAIKVIKGAMTAREFEGYLTGNVVKYITRWRYKGGVEDLHKARWYIDYLIETLEPQKTRSTTEGQWR